MEGKFVCLTAAGQISQTLASAFIEEGAQVCLTHPVLEVAETIVVRLGPSAEAIQLDMASRQSIDCFLGLTSARGGLDVLINHQSDIGVSPFLDITETNFDEAFTSNVRGPTLTLIGVSRQMVSQRKAGSIINRLGQLGSTTRDRGAPSAAVFAATNAALVSLTRSAAMALAEHGIRVNAVAPGPIGMPMWERLDAAYAAVEQRRPGEKTDAIVRSVPMGRFGTAADLVGATLFLASDESRFVTGQVLDVDGGHALSGA